MPRNEPFCVVASTVEQKEAKILAMRVASVVQTTGGCVRCSSASWPPPRIPRQFGRRRAPLKSLALLQGPTNTRLPLRAMSYSRALILAAFSMSVATGMQGQDFVNGDLEGPAPTGLTQLPTSWQAVPDNDPVCLATNGSLGDTPDLTDINGPSEFAGIFGNPFSGNTFVSGERGGGNVVFQEGIMQQVQGFVPGSAYTIVLHQAVVKSYGNFDSSGSWAVYVNNALAGTTAPTMSAVPYDSAPFAWEQRTVPFTATASSHTIKFLPVDDDANLDVLDPNGSLRMGIDLVIILPGHHTTGLADHAMLDEWTLAPNPVMDDLVIETTRPFVLGSVRIHSAAGSLIHGQGLISGAQRTTIDLATIQPGIYLVCITLDGSESRHRLVKE